MDTINFDCSKQYGSFKPLNGVNNGPVHTPKFSAVHQLSTFDAFREAKIPFARTHDAAIHMVYGGRHSVDVSAIFPDFGADPTGPNSYDFATTDSYIDLTVSAGAEPFYRLGEVFDTVSKPYHTIPPADYQKFAVICEHIIRHYTTGWANGFYHRIRYWEIWNEADLGNDFFRANSIWSWAGTKEQFFDFFEVVAKHLKTCFPDLKIGGPAAAASDGDPWTEEFICEMSRRNVPLDFFSWHIYCADPAKVVEKALWFRSLLTEHGYGYAENIIDEWNYMEDQTVHFTRSIEAIIGMKGAAYAMACMSEAQKIPIDKMMYYCAGPYYYNGLFDYYTCRPLKGYHVFKWFSEFRDLAELRTDDHVEDIYTLCGTDKDGKITAVITYYTNDETKPEKTLCIDFEKTGSYDLHYLDADRTDEITEQTNAPVLRLRPNSCVMIRET